MCLLNRIPFPPEASLRAGDYTGAGFGSAQVFGKPVPMLSADQVFRDYAPKVSGLARRLLGNEADAEEATQEVFLQVVRKLHTFRGEAALGTWLYRIAFHAILDYREKRAHHEGRQPVALPVGGDQWEEPRAAVRAGADNPKSQVLDQERQDMIAVAIAELPSTYRHVFVLADVENHSNAEVGDLLGLSLAAVKSRLHRARQLLRKALTPYFEECVALAGN